jgi:hypothetical protein
VSQERLLNISTSEPQAGGSLPLKKEPVFLMALLKTFFTVLAFISLLFASGVPVEDMSNTIIGIEYKGMVTGQTITRAAVPANFKAHYCMFRYTPLPYLLISLGFGGNKFSIAEYNSTRFTGDPSFSAAAGLNLFSPLLINRFVGTGGVQTYLLNSKHRDYRYTAALVNPTIGMRMLAGEFVDLEAGVKGLFLYGKMKGPEKHDGGTTFSNNNYPRGYISAILHSTSSAVYATFTADVSPYVKSDISNGLNEAAFSVQLGILLSQERFKKTAYRTKNDDNYRNFDKIQGRQEKMAEELNAKE